MEYIVSARKYRPLTFDAVVGQRTLTTTLRNAIRTEKLAHAYLFCGPRGVGKTTCARIFARAINCFNPVEGDACGECESCVAMGENRSYNVFELDAASNNSVEDIKQLMEQTRIPPQVGKYKVFIIDEVHMLSTAAFNAFLKTLEEPPAHVIFVLATTEKHKLLPTIISRCQIYDFERMTIENTIAHLRMVAEREGYTYDEEALNVIAEKADGGMRDARSIFDQVASYTQGDLSYAKVIEDLNVLDVDNYFRIIDFALENKVMDIMLLANNVMQKGFDGGNLCAGLAKHVRNVMMASNPQTTALLEMSAQLKARYAEQAKRAPSKFMYSALKVLNQCDVNYRQSSNKRLLAEITLIQVAQITQEDDSPSSGLCPTRLKQIFALLTAYEALPNTNNNKVVGATSSAVASRDETPETSSSSSSSSTTTTTTTTISSSSSESDLPSDADSLTLAWLTMCNNMSRSPEYMGLAERLKNVKPQMKSDKELEEIVENSMLYRELRALANRVAVSMQKALGASELSVTIRQAEQEEIKRLPTKHEMLEELKKSNPAIGLLFSNFGL